MHSVPRKKMRKISDVIAENEGGEFEVSLEHKLSIPKTDPRYGTMNLQGGATDGRHAYYLMVEHGREPGKLSKLLKVSLDTWQIVGEGNHLPLDHGNDMAYDPRRGLLVAVHCQINREDVSFIDPETLAVVGRKRLDTGGQYAIAYSAERDRYVIGKSRCFDVGVCDGELKLLETILGEDGHTQQGMECDERYIYCLQSSVRNNYLWYYSWDGEFCGMIKLPMVGEAENLFVMGDKMVVAFNNGKTKMGDIYVMTLGAKEKSGERA